MDKAILDKYVINRCKDKCTFTIKRLQKIKRHTGLFQWVLFVLSAVIPQKLSTSDAEAIQWPPAKKLLENLNISGTKKPYEFCCNK